MRTFDPETYPLDPDWFLRPASIHGLSHTRRVLIHGHAIALSVGLDPVEFEALVSAIAWHDIGRTHDGHDLEHGAKSVARARELGLLTDLAPAVAERVVFAIELHSTHDEVAEERASSPIEDEPSELSEPLGSHEDRESLLRILWVLKDADGLDRVRIADLDPWYLRHEVSRQRVASAGKLLYRVP